MKGLCQHVSLRGSPSRLAGAIQGTGQLEEQQEVTSLVVNSEMPPNSFTWSHLLYILIIRACIITVWGLPTTMATNVRPLTEGEPVLTVTDSYWVNVRSGPTLDASTVLDKVAGGTQLRSLESQGDWYRVELLNGREGWISAEFAVEDTARTHLTVSAPAASVRQSADSEAPQVKKVTAGLRLHILGSRGEWFNVLLPDGAQGWVRKDLVSIEAAQALAPAESPLRTGPMKEASLEKVKPASPGMLAPPSRFTGPDSTEPEQSVRASWVPKKPEALLVSFVVGTSMFIVLSLAGSLLFFQRNLIQIKSRLPRDDPEDPRLRLDQSAASEMSGLIQTTDRKLSKLDEAIEGCLVELRKPQNTKIPDIGDANVRQLAITVQRQQQQIVHYLELIALQHRKLDTYQKENFEIRNLIRQHPLSRIQSIHARPSQLRKETDGLSIKPA